MIPAAPKWSYVGVVDPGTRGPNWLAVVLTADWTDRRVVTWHKEWPSLDGVPVPIRTTMLELAQVQADYRLEGWLSEAAVSSRIREIAEELHTPFHARKFTPEAWHNIFESLRVMVEEQRIEMPADPNMRDDLLNVKRKLLSGGPGIELPTSTAGRHADYARLLAIGASEPIQAGPRPTTAPLPRRPPVDEEAEILARLERQDQKSPFARTPESERHKFWQR